MSANLLSASASGTTTPRSKIDALSREDLIRFVKKQIERLKTVKAENEVLKGDLTRVQLACEEAESRRRIESEAYQEKIDQISEKCERLIVECAELRVQTVTAKNELEGTLIENIDGETDEQSPAVGNAVVQRELDMLRSSLADTTDKLNKETDEKEGLQQTVAELRSFLDDAHLQIEAFKEKRSVENVISLEMADCEKSIERLQKELKVANEEKYKLIEEVEDLKSRLDSSEEGKNRLTDNVAKLKAAAKKLKTDLDEKKGELTACQEAKQSLEEQIEKINSGFSAEKLQFSTVICVNEEKINELESINASLNRQLISLRSQRESLQRQYDDVMQEHAVFKTRALYVLEQKKGEFEEINKDEVETLEETIRQQKKSIDNLTQSHRILQNELSSTNDHVKTLSQEISNLQTQLTATKEAHKTQLKEQRVQFESRLASETKLNSELSAQIDANYVAYTREKETILENAKREHERLTTELEHLKRTLEEEVRRRKEAEMMQTPENISLRQPVIVPRFKGTFLERPSVTECFENTTASANEDHSLKDVIYGENEKKNDESLWIDSSLETPSHEDIDILRKQLEHARELLNDSEAANAKLTEQSKLLKEEIRRLERNAERISHFANTEYLKNVILKFIAPEKVSEERGHLVPVLATMLKLSSEEINLLSEVAQVNVGTVQSKTSSWGSYLHRWSGVS